MHQALPVQLRAGEFGLMHRAVSGIGIARFACAPSSASFVTPGSTQ
ncbi:hypothetical protein [Burkholderia contaminans]|nr:hypothetical protein [Burkholderia contaminans]